MGVRVRQRKSAWWVYIHHKGKRKAKKIGDHKTALAVARKIEAELALGLTGLDGSESPTFREYATEWLRTYAAVHCKERTVEGYEAIIKNHLVPAFGDLALRAITRGRIKLLIAMKVEANHGRGTIRNILAPLRGVLNHAQEDGLISANPASRLGRFNRAREGDRATKINPFTQEEVIQLLEAARNFCPRYYPIFLCAVRTGMRQGELLALQWGDIDFRGRFIEVRRAMSQRRLTTPKSGKVRQVDMSRELTQVLADLRGRREVEEALEGRALDPRAWVFTNGVGSQIDRDNLVKRVFYPCLQKAGLRRIRFHDLRHTYASLLIQNGESLVYVKEQMGHHSIQVTVDTYGHLIPGANKAAVDRLDSVQPNATYTQPGTDVGL